MEKKMEYNMKTYITAAEVITALGTGVAANVRAVESGLSGVAERNDPRLSCSPVMAAVIPDETYASVAAQYGGQDMQDGILTRTELLLAAVIGSIVRQTGISLSSPDTFIIFSSTKGNVSLLDPSAPEQDSRACLWRMGERVAARFGAAGRCCVISNACISGVSALVVGRRLVLSGKYRKIIVAGCDTLSRFIVSGFASFRSLSNELCRPYDSRRDGLNLGEAAGAILISDEFREGAVVLSGGAISDDANHISGPSRTGDGLFFAMRNAMREAGVQPDDISFLNMHGTATVYNDEMESKAIALAGLSSVPVQSLKPYFGHTLGASGVIETVMAASQLRRGIVWGTKGFGTPGTPMPLNVSASPRQVTMRHCVKAASGFGGCNAAVVLSLPEYTSGKSGTEDMGDAGFRPAASYRIIRTVTIRDGKLTRDGKTVFSTGTGEFGEFARALYHERGRADLKFFKMDNLCKLGYLAAGELFDGIEFGPEEMALVLSDSSSSMDSDLRHLESLAAGGEAAASPSVFVYTLPNVVAGEICIRHKIKGENTFFISREYEPDKLREYASMVLSRNGVRYCTTGWCEYVKGSYEAVFELLADSSGETGIPNRK